MNSNESFDALNDFSMDIMEHMHLPDADVIDDMSFFDGMDQACNNQVEGIQELIQIDFENTAPSQTLVMEPPLNNLYSLGQDEFVTSSNQDLQCTKVITDDNDDDASELTMGDDSYYSALSLESDMEIQVSVFKLVQSMQRSEMSRSILSNFAVQYPNIASFASGVDQNRIQLYNYMNTVGCNTL